MKPKCQKLKGPLYAHLGHFAQDKYVQKGHNSSGKPGELRDRGQQVGGGGSTTYTPKYGETGAVGSRQRGMNTADSNQPSKPYSRAQFEELASEKGRLRGGKELPKEDWETLMALEREMKRNAAGKIPNTYFTEKNAYDKARKARK
jgi:hypothetical protein